MKYSQPLPTAESEFQSPPDPPRLLLIEDNRDTSDLMGECIEDHFGQGVVQFASSLAQARQFSADQFDLVLSDMHLPDGLGLELLSELLAQRPNLPVVFVTAESATDRAIEAIRAGAYDYVVKAGDYLLALPVMIEKNLAQARTKEQNARLLEQIREQNRQLENAVEQLRHVASTDSLTELANRRSFANEFEARFAERVRDGRDLALLMMDLDGFKRLNDTLGHPAGDRVLSVLADVLRANCRVSDQAGRFGGDEFILLLNQADESQGMQVARRIDRQFRQAAQEIFGELQYHDQVAVSMGLTTLHGGKAFTPEQMFTQADQSMYQAKASVKAAGQTGAGADPLMVYRTQMAQAVPA